MRENWKYFAALLVLVIGATWYAFIPGPEEDCIDDETQLSEQFEQKEAQTHFGIPADNYKVVKDHIKNGQNLSDILLPYGVSYERIIQLANQAKSVFDVRYMKYNKPYTLLIPKDSANKAAYFIYENSLVDYVVFDLKKDSIYTGKKVITTQRKVASGVINSSLALTLQEIKASPLLTLSLSDIYAWTIDFYRLQKGDAFKVIYTENFVDGKSVGIDHILACEFTHGGQPFYAFYFEQDSVGDYFDEEANSLRKAFLKAPLKFSHITSHYSQKRFHPILKRNKPHLGTDYAAPTGTPILAVGDGTIIKRSYTKGNGNYVKIRHNSTYTTQYLHMSKFAKGQHVGSVVRQGEVIGYVGSTGLATGPHVCFRFWKNGKQVDHLKEKFPPSKPVKASEKERYMQLVDQYMQQLQGVGLQASL